MKAIILAGGLGTRLNLDNIPKPMYKLNNKPILEHNILLLRKHNTTDICIALYHMPEVIKEYFGDGKKWKVNIQYSLEEKPLGTSGALKNAEWFFEEQPFFVIYGDNYTNVDLNKMLQFHLSTNNHIATIAVFDQNKSLNSNIAGGILTVDQNNNLISFKEGKEKNNLGYKCYVNAGIYILNPEIFKKIPRNVQSDIGKDIFPKLIKEKTMVKAYLTSGFVLAIDTNEALKNAEKVLSQEGLSNDND